MDRLDLLGVEVVVAGGRLRDHPNVEVDDHDIALAAMRPPARARATAGSR